MSLFSKKNKMYLRKKGVFARTEKPVLPDVLDFISYSGIFLASGFFLDFRYFVKHELKGVLKV